MSAIVNDRPSPMASATTGARAGGRSRIAPAAVLLVAALIPVLSGCGALPLLTAGKPALSDAPRVPDPRDLRGTPACELVGPAEFARFGLDPASAKAATQKIDDTQSVEHCNYRARDLLSHLSLTSAYRLDPGGLDRLYLNREGAPVFEPETLDGFPLVRTEPEDSDACDLNIGVADDQVLVVGFARLPGYTGPAPCENARALASAVLANLPPLR